jgi:hypothetical protein
MASNERKKTKVLERAWRETEAAYFMFHTGILLKKLRKAMTNLSPKLLHEFQGNLVLCVYIRCCPAKQSFVHIGQI